MYAVFIYIYIYMYIYIYAHMLCKFPDYNHIGPTKKKHQTFVRHVFGCALSLRPGDTFASKALFFSHGTCHGKKYYLQDISIGYMYYINIG